MRTTNARPGKIQWKCMASDEFLGTSDQSHGHVECDTMEREWTGRSRVRNIVKQFSRNEKDDRYGRPAKDRITNSYLMVL